MKVDRDGMSKPAMAFADELGWLINDDWSLYRSYSGRSLKLRRAGTGHCFTIVLGAGCRRFSLQDAAHEAVFDSAVWPLCTNPRHAGRGWLRRFCLDLTAAIKEQP